MNKQYSWKRTEDMEIDLADLLLRLCRKWKQAAACALVCGVILGGYGWMTGRENPDAAESDAIQEAELTQEEEQSVMAAVQLWNEISSLQTYMDNSVLMQIDPYHKHKSVMLCCIDNADRRELPRITESYLNYIVNGAAAEELKKSGSSEWKRDKSYLAELMSAYQKTYSSPYQITVEDAADSSMLSESLFYIEIVGRDSDAAKQMALDMQTVLKKYSKEVKEAAGSHKLTFVSSVESVTADSGLQTQQHDKKAVLASNRTNLKAMTDVFSRQQMELYTAASGQKEEDILEDDVNTEKSGSGVKYMFMGLLAGIFVYGAVFSCRYLFDDTVKSIEEMKSLYTFPFYGGILLKGRNRKSAGALSGAEKNACECGKAQVIHRIRLLCNQSGMSKLYAASDFMFEAQEKSCLESMAEQLKRWGICLVAAENICADPAAWEDLADTGSVLMICRMGTTTHKMIDDTMSFYLDNGIAVIGAAAFLRDEQVLWTL